jgi:hypothetical protein
MPGWDRLEHAFRHAPDRDERNRTVMRRTASAAAALLLSLLLAGCGSEDASAPEPDQPSAQSSAQSSTQSSAASSAESSGPATESPTEDPDTGGSDEGGESGVATVEIEVEGDRVEPNGRRVQLPAGEPLRLRIESDRAAELHVHSSPEQTLSVQPGESSRRLVIERPGLVEVEEHETGIVVLQLEVR